MNETVCAVTISIKVLIAGLYLADQFLEWYLGRSGRGSKIDVIADLIVAIGAAVMKRRNDESR